MADQHRSIRRCALLIAAVLAPALHAQDTNQTVTEIRFEGNTRRSDASLLSIVRSRVGVAFNQEVADEDAVRLMRTGRFLAAVAETESKSGGLAIVFRLRERPTIGAVRFEGNRAVKDTTLRDQVSVKVGDLFDSFAVREGRDAILSAYHERGYGYVAVGVDVDQVRDTGDLVYMIEEGPRVRVRKIRFEGNRSIEDGELRKLTKSTTALWIIRTGAFDPDQVVADAATIRAYYRDQGFLDARVSYRIDRGEDEGDLTIVFTIDEGREYRIESIRFEGNSFRTESELLDLIESRPQHVFKQSRLDADTGRVKSLYGQHGYIYAAVRPVRVYSATDGFVVITFRVNEGERVSVGRVEIRGNTETQDKVVRRAIDLFPGDVFNLSLSKDAEGSLRQTQLFDSVTLTPVGNDPGVRDLLVNVTEAERGTRDFAFGFGVTSDAGLVGNILFENKNFDLYDTPRTFAEFVKGRAFRGAGQRLRLELQPGTELNRFRLDFTEPYLFDRPLRFDVSLYHFTRNRRQYREQRTGGLVSFGKRLVDGLTSRQYFKDWYGELAFRAEVVQLNNVDIFNHKSVRDSAASSILTSAKATLVRDRTDNRFLPSSGDRWTMSIEQFVGDYNFAKVRAGYIRHITTNTDDKGRKSILSLRADGGYIIGDAPVFEKFYAGGIGSLRGFNFRGAGPHRGLNSEPIGGDLLITTSVDYSFPLVGKALRGVLFTDMGTVEEDLGITKWRAAVGVGLRFTIELFGPIPIEIDLALPISSDEDDEERVFSFFIGRIF